MLWSSIYMKRTNTVKWPLPVLSAFARLKDFWILAIVNGMKGWNVAQPK